MLNNTEKDIFDLLIVAIRDPTVFDIEGLQFDNINRGKLHIRTFLPLKNSG